MCQGKADFAKGNRFRDFAALRKMPLIRRIGNMGLGFLAKAATGYWNLFDPTNGFLAIRAETLAQLPLDQIDRGYYFEISMLANLYLLGAVVQDVPMPARYRDEVSNLAVERVLLEFPFKLLGTFVRRVVLKNFLYDFSMVSIYLLDRAAAAAVRLDLRRRQVAAVLRLGVARTDRHGDPAHAVGAARHPVAAFCHGERPALGSPAAAFRVRSRLPPHRNEIQRVQRLQEALRRRHASRCSPRPSRVDWMKSASRPTRTPIR